uniref:Uncharacterized protein n=1 Tax=Arundo donax TaxID=35708 RepID=A0A0A9BUY4_ARUDO
MHSNRLEVNWTLLCWGTWSGSVDNISTSPMC